MASPTKRVEKYLISLNSDDYLQKLYKFCLEKVKAGELVILLTSVLYDFSMLIAELDMNLNELKNFIHVYYKKLDQISFDFPIMRHWPLIPSMIVVDLPHLLETADCTSFGLMYKVQHCATYLLNYLQAMENKLARVGNGENLTNKTNGVFILRSGDNFSDAQIETIKDLYFYDTDWCTNFDAVKSLISNAAQ